MAGVADTVDEVIAALHAVVDQAQRDGDRIGYFAALYRQVTLRVHEGITTGFFDDPERMARLDVVFATRYLDALDTFRADGRPTRSWLTTFEAASRWRPLILQHLLVAINAHINLDLGIAAATTAPGDSIHGMRRDFERVNEILAAMIAEVQRNLVEVSPWLRWLDRFGARRNDEVVRFSIVVARAEAWRFATELAPLAEDAWAAAISTRDARVARLADSILHPGFLSTGLLMIRVRESSDVGRVLAAMTRTTGPSLEQVDARVADERASDPDDASGQAP